MCITSRDGLDEWDVYATCYVKDNLDIVVDKCKLIENGNCDIH